MQLFKYDYNLFDKFFAVFYSTLPVIIAMNSSYMNQADYRFPQKKDKI